MMKMKMKQMKSDSVLLELWTVNCESTDNDDE